MWFPSSSVEGVAGQYRVQQDHLGPSLFQRRVSIALGVRSSHYPTAMYASITPARSTPTPGVCLITRLESTRLIHLTSAHRLLRPPPLVSHSHQYPSISHSCPTHLMYALVPTPIHQSHQLVNDDLLYDPLAPVARGDVHALLALLVELDKLRQGAGFDALEEGLDEVDVDVGGEERGGDASEC
jgi:hypothetical protein